jgi:hypothetical protein
VANAEKLTRLFAALGADDPQSWAESEVEENLPQLARFRLLRALRRDIQAWDTASIASLLNEITAKGTHVADPAVDVEHIARAVARETTFSVLYRLADSYSDGLPVDLQQQLPGWVLMETTPAGEPTARVMDALYEDLDPLDPAAEVPQSGTVLEGWIWETNLRPFCESLAEEVAYDFDDSDWLAIETALPETDNERPHSAWYTYPLVGRTRVDLCIAQSVGGSEVSVSVQGAVDSHVRNRIELLLDMMARYEIAPR